MLHVCPAWVVFLRPVNMFMHLFCRYVAFAALQAGTVPQVLITGGAGHSTQHLYDAVSKHPVWSCIPVGGDRTEADVLQDIFFSLGGTKQQLLPLETKSSNCGGNAELSKQMIDRECPHITKIIVVQVRRWIGNRQPAVSSQAFIT